MNEQHEHAATEPATDRPPQRQNSEQQPSQLLNTDAFLIRLAQELRSKGDPELPLSIYLDQAKHLLLAGHTPKDTPSSTATAHAANDHVYQSWALGRG